MHYVHSSQQYHTVMIFKRCCSVLLLLLAACAAPPEPSPATLAIIEVTVIDGDRASGPMTVLIDGDTITAVAPAAVLTPPPGVPVVDGSGRFLIPGLWDMHIHLANDEDPPISPEHQLLLHLAHGVVGVRDMGSDWQTIEDLRARLAAGEIRGPEVLSPGPFVVGPQQASATMVPVANADEARAAVRSLGEQGVDFIKAQASLSRDAYLALVDEATALGQEVHGHVPDAMTALEVSAAGQRTLEHVSPALPSDGALLFSCSSREDELRRELAAIATAREAEDADRHQLAERDRNLKRALIESYDPEKAAALAATLTAHGARVVPTMIWSQTYSPFDAEANRSAPLEVLPEATRVRWDEVWRGYFENTAEDQLALNRQIAEGSRTLVKTLKDAGVRVLAGTDSPFFLLLPGFGLHQELELLVAAGFTPGEALAAATRDVADFLGRLDESGTVGVGRRADLVLLDADPLADIRNTREIQAVIQGGRLYPREELDAMIAEVALAGKPPIDS